MRLPCVAAGLLVVLAACGSSSAATHGFPTGTSTTTSATTTKPASTPCGPAGAKTLAVDRRARVYVRHSIVYGCAKGGQKVYALGHHPQTRPGQARVGVIALAGVDVAYGLSQMGVDNSSASVIVRRLTDGRQLHAADATDRHFVEAGQTIGSIVVKADGAVAWIGVNQSFIASGHRAVEVHRIDARGPALLDSGNGIKPGSLRRHGSTLTWRDGSATRSATLR